MKRTRRSLVWVLVLTMALSGLPSGALAEELSGSVEPEAVAEVGLVMEESESHFPGNETEDVTAQEEVPEVDAQEEVPDAAIPRETSESAAPEENPESVAEEAEEVLPAAAEAPEEGEDLPAVQSNDDLADEDGWYVKWSMDSNGNVTIGEGTEEEFWGGPEVKTVTIKNVSSIPAEAFWLCDNLTKVTIATSVTRIGKNAFGSCDKITSVVYQGTAAQWEAIDIAYGNVMLVRKCQYPGQYRQVYLGEQTVVTKKSYYFTAPSDGDYYFLLSGCTEGECFWTDIYRPGKVKKQNYDDGICWSMSEDGIFEFIVGKTSQSGNSVKLTILPTDQYQLSLDLYSIDNTASGIRISWEEHPRVLASYEDVGCADGAMYKVYRKTSGTGWEAITDLIIESTYTDKTAQAGTTYTYTVRGFHIDEEGHTKAFDDFDKTGLTAVRLVNMKPTLANVTNGVQVSWTKASGAKGYYVYRKSGTGSYARIANITNGSTVSYTDTAVNAKSGTTYTYAVRAYNGSSLSSYTGVSILRLGTIKPTLSNAATGIAVNWSKVTGAKGYYVYRKSGTGSYAKVATITDGSTVAYTDTAVNTKSGTTYTYAVRAYSGSTAGYYTGASILRLGTIKPTLSNTSAGITVKWAKVTGAKGYYVYRKSGSGSYAKIKTITDGSTLSYSDTASALVNGTAYTYAVRAYNGSTAGYYTAVGTYRLKGVSISSLTNKATRKMVVKWSADSKAHGYQVQYSTTSDFSSGNQAVSIDKNSTVSTTIESLTKGKTYYVRVRTYKKTAAGSPFYSGWSAAKSVKISK